jgi:phosphoenolpyruvate-protein kinase (PTS system EI component)
MPKIGMMLETKEALNHIYDFSDVDFISIGTNDLTHELYKVNRLEALEESSKYMDDMMQKIKAVVDFANKNNVSLSICGELASIFESALLFYKAGVKNLSVSPQGIRVLNAAYTEFKQN